MNLAFIFTYLYFIIWTNGQEDNTVEISQGSVRGLSSEDGTYSMYLGIPYAVVDPDNPFGESLPEPIFQETFEANDDGAICPQIEEFNNTIVGTLDCLHVNVYVPSTASVDNPLPVMVWIYGGSYAIGFAGRYMYGPQYLVRHDVILVTFNYRLGPYGFMCLDIPSVPGNAGLKDQRKALRWVNENIAAFGGDASKITLFGESAGGCSTEFHLTSTGSSGLFQQIIMQSGSMLVGGVIESKPNTAIELAAYLGFVTSSTEDAINFLKDVQTDELIQAYHENNMFLFPCIEQEFEGVESFILDYPEDIFAKGEFESLPMLVGYNQDENMYLHVPMKNNEEYFESLQSIVYEKMRMLFNFDSEDKFQRVSKLLHEFYFGTDPVSSNNINDLIKFDSDLVFIYPIERSIKYHLAKSTLPLYQYLFAYSGDINFTKRRLNITEEEGAAHADDIAYLFKQSYLANDPNPEDQLVIDRMTAMWTNFAKYGDPTPGVSDLLPIRWPTVSAQREFLRIDSELTLDAKPFNRRVANWDLIFEAYGDNFKKTWFDNGL